MTTLSDLKTRIRERSDKVNSQFITESELTSLINASYAELYDIIVLTGQDYFTIKLPFTMASADAGVYNLPDNFYKFKGLDYLLGAFFITIYPFDWTERNDQQRAVNLLSGLDIRYRIMGTTLHIEPRDNATGSYQLWYIPAYTPLIADTDIVDTQITRQNWEEYIVADVAAKILDKEESNSDRLVAAKERIRMRITEFAADRDIDQPMKVSDTGRGRRRWWTRTGADL